MNTMEMLESTGGELCLIDEQGQIHWQPKVAVDTIGFPKYGLVQAGKDGKYGYLNPKGEIEIPMRFAEAHPFSENGLAFVKEDYGLGGYIDRSGKYVIDPMYETGSTFNFGLAAVSEDGDYTFIFANGRKAIDYTFRYASGFANCGLATVQIQDGRYELMDTTSRPILTLKKGCKLTDFIEHGRITTFQTNGAKALIDAAGGIITGFQYDEVIITPNQRLYPFLRNGLWGYLDMKGNEVIPNIYLEVSEFTKMYTGDPLAFVKAFHPLAENNMYTFFINGKDEIINDKDVESRKKELDRTYAHVSIFKQGIAIAEKTISRGNKAEVERKKDRSQYIGKKK